MRSGILPRMGHFAALIYLDGVLVLGGTLAPPVADLTTAQYNLLTVIDALPDGTVFDAALIGWLLLEMPEAEAARQLDELVAAGHLVSGGRGAAPGAHAHLRTGERDSMAATYCS